MKDIVFHITGMGHCPAFKNRKMIARGRLITEPKVHAWMVRATEAMSYMWKSLCQTTAAETSTECSPQSATALPKSLPTDDNWKEIPMKIIRVRKVPKGEEGLLITLRKIKN